MSESKPKLPEKPAIIELKIHGDDKSLPYYIRIQKGDPGFDVLSAYAEMVVMRIERGVL